MNKKDAAEYLEVSERTLERYAKQGKLNPTETRGKTRKVLEYDADELARLKSELDGATNADTTNSDNTDSDDESETALATIPKIKSRFINPLHKSPPKDNQSEALQVLATLAENSAQPVQETAAKLLLKLDEAALLTGLSRQTLRAAIADGTLKASLIGRTWRIKRADLDKYIAEL